MRQDSDPQAVYAFDAGPVPEEDEYWDTDAYEGFTDEAKQEFWDDVNGGWLEAGKVRQARKEEMDWMSARQVFTIVSDSECKRSKQSKPLTWRWLDTRKPSGRYRSRLVVREIKKAKPMSQRLRPEEVFSAMPPVESLKMLISEMMTEQPEKTSGSLGGTEDQRQGQGPLCLANWDISRAHFYGDAERELYVELPDELKSPGMCARLNRSAYGTQDASHIWGEKWTTVLTEGGATIGISNRALFRNSYLKGFCHGDDFIGLGTRKNL